MSSFLGCIFSLLWCWLCFFNPFRFWEMAGVSLLDIPWVVINNLLWLFNFNLFIAFIISHSLCKGLSFLIVCWRLMKRIITYLSRPAVLESLFLSQFIIVGMLIRNVGNVANFCFPDVSPMGSFLWCVFPWLRSWLCFFNPFRCWEMTCISLLNITWVIIDNFIWFLNLQVFIAFAISISLSQRVTSLIIGWSFSYWVITYL